MPTPGTVTLILLTSEGDKVWRSRTVPAETCLDAAYAWHRQHPHLPLGVFQDPTGETGDFMSWHPEDEGWDRRRSTYKNL